MCTNALLIYSISRFRLRANSILEIPGRTASEQYIGPHSFNIIVLTFI